MTWENSDRRIIAAIQFVDTTTSLQFANRFSLSPQGLNFCAIAVDTT
jgi:hypothetical protein